MKALCLLPLALLVAACGNDAPSIDDLKEDSYPLVEQVLTEDGTVQLDSTKYYVDVEINFHGTDYDKYTVNVYRNE